MLVNVLRKNTKHENGMKSNEIQLYVMVSTSQQHKFMLLYFD